MGKNLLGGTFVIKQSALPNVGKGVGLTVVFFNWKRSVKEPTTQNEKYVLSSDRKSKKVILLLFAIDGPKSAVPYDHG